MYSETPVQISIKKFFACEYLLHIFNMKSVHKKRTLMKINTFLFAIVVLISFTSCSKSENTSPVPPPPVVFGTILTKVYEVDTTKAAPADTINRWSFTYDNLNRLIIDSFTSLTTYSGSIYYIINKIEYTGTDTFAYRKTQRAFKGSNFMSADTVYYKFVNSRYDSDTMVFDYGLTFPPGTARNKFTYSANVITRNFQNWVPQNSYTATEVQKIYLTIVNNNIIAQRDTIVSSVNGFPQPTPTIFTTNVSYLSNPNPFYSLTASYSNGYFRIPGIGNIANRSYAPRNLISQQTSSYGSITYDYTFRSDGYPLIARVNNNQNGTSLKTKLLFVYR